MKKIKAKLGLIAIDFGIWVYSLGEGEAFTDEDKKALKRLHVWRDHFSGVLNGDC